MRFKGLDLNLLVALDVLLEERSVTRAAERLYVSQPAMSGTLSRLRDYFRDDILVSNGKRMFPTAFAESLVPRLRACLGDLDALVSPTSFNPLLDERMFRIISSDFSTITILSGLCAKLQRIAPAIKIDIIPTDIDSLAALAEGKADLLLMPDTMSHPDHPAELLFEERYVVVGWSGNPLFDRPITQDDFLASGHVVTAFGRNRLSSFGDQQLARLGIRRRVEVTCGSFGNIPWLVAGTQRIALMHERMARMMAGHLPISISPLPFDLPVMREVAQYHAARSNDEALGWLLSQLHEACAQPL
ncbi:MAG: transcriptional regulator, LysR family [Novosphingobium lindaniclasticum]|jgi:DNA-binding transcriptional LysR family regulator|uniref:LysR family transcriptional regulator n=1 Tax=Novosphingobium lindaniclasticum TaxID=1329895 RepID=UPI0024098E47|nr:LysR family transcriptional regulator [Novosphingobium lindaniclasticum]MDF2640350.1 transcriptional regulator, LysR family [Novosphingobium lindaniclasticum]